MNRNIHNIDEVFNMAYQTYKDDPSTTAWEKLSAAIDKEDAEKYKRRFISWKRVAVILVFLLSGFLIYETGVIIKRKNTNDQAMKENINDSIFELDYTNDTQKKTSSETKTNRQDANKSVASYENSEQLPPSQVLKEINEDGIDETKTNQQITTLFEQSENNIKTSKIKKFNEGNKPKVNFRHDVIVEEGIGSLLDIKASIRKKGSTQIKNNQTANIIVIKKDSIRRLLNLPITSVTRFEIPKNSISYLIIKQPVMPVITTISSTAQSKKKKSPTSPFKPFWRITAFASNDWGKYKLDNDVIDIAGNQDEKDEINQREKHESSYSSGVFTTRQFNKHLALKTGLIYSNTAISISPQEMYAAKKTDGSVAYKYITSSGYGFINPSFGFPPAIGDSLQSTEAQHNLQMISIPLMLSYRLEKNKFAIAPTLGLSANFITCANVKTEVTDALNKEAVTISGLDGMRNFSTGLIGDISLEYNYNSKWSISLLPGFKYALTPITKGNVVKTFPYSFNIGAGITYKL